MRNKRYFPLGGFGSLIRVFMILCLAVAFVIVPAFSNAEQASPERPASSGEYYSAASGGRALASQALQEPAPEVREMLHDAERLCFLFSSGGLPRQLSDGVVGMEYLWWVAPDLASRRGGRITVFLPIYSFLKVGGGEWVPLQQSFSGKRRYLGAVRSFLHFRGDTDRTRLISA